LHGIFEEPMGPAERVQVLMRFLGQVNCADVAVADLERVPEIKREGKRSRRIRGCPL